MNALSEVKFSVLDLAPVVQGGTVADAFRNTLDLAQHVERWGYQRFWLAEHHNIAGIASAATSVLIGHVAAGTKTIRVGSGGIMLPNHAPLVIAEHFGTLETLFPGRIDLGLGRAPGSDQMTARALMRDASAGELFPQLVDELLSLMGTAKPGQQVRAMPGEGTNVPVWLLGSSTFSAQLAAMMGLPFAFAGQFAPRLMQEALHLYRKKFQPSERWPKPYVMIGLPLFAADEDAEAHRLATSAYQQILALHRGSPIALPPPLDRAGDMVRLWSPMEEAGVRSHLAAAVIGGPETVRKKLLEVVAETRADELMFNSPMFRHEDRLRSYELLMQARDLEFGMQS
ncbi:LLM class flavin-dependent oxidoreductase [Phragmitibacter flavus]|uniref:Luciferase-like monooxygenase n=1 Tax=Phragmitibacter flavus TaxID=2576071 RepID=A0A5R8K7Z6_9BACT|nr:LLM class flavin-dependent oxidoreductase [Phragmitibacter flavus]TLD68462.1 LLM class flavin-dependent oxidoreductase [Phragmitibacter flavus]